MKFYEYRYENSLWKLSAQVFLLLFINVGEWKECFGIFMSSSLVQLKRAWSMIVSMKMWCLFQQYLRYTRNNFLNSQWKENKSIKAFKEWSNESSEK